MINLGDILNKFPSLRTAFAERNASADCHTICAASFYFVLRLQFHSYLYTIFYMSCQEKENVVFKSRQQKNKSTRDLDFAFSFSNWHHFTFESYFLMNK